MATQRFAQSGRTEACPEWAHGGLLGMTASSPNLQVLEAYPEWAHKACSDERTSKACPEWAHGGLPRMGAERHA